MAAAWFAAFFERVMNMAKRLPAGFRLRKDGNYELRFTVKKKRYSVYAASVQECKEKEIVLREQIKNGLYTENRNLTLDGYYAEWKKARSGVVKGNTTVGVKSRYKNHIKPVFGDRKLCDIERREILKFQSDLTSKLKVSSVNAVLTLLKTILNDAVKDGIITRNPAVGVKFLKDVDKPAAETYHRALTEEEQSAFMSAAKDEWLYELIALLLCTGMRIGEASALTWQDIDYKNNVIHITKTVTRTEDCIYTIGTPKSRAGVRDIPLNDSIKAILKSQREKQTMLHGNLLKIENPIFESCYGNRVYDDVLNNAIRRTIKKVNKEAGKEVIQYFSAHGLRDTFATRFIESGGNPQTLKVILGHSSLAMTMDLYSHVMPNTKQKEMDNIKIAF